MPMSLRCAWRKAPFLLSLGTCARTDEAVDVEEGGSKCAMRDDGSNVARAWRAPRNKVGPRPQHLRRSA